MPGCTFADRLRTAREAAGISREQAAVAAGRSWGTIRFWETGTVLPPLDRLMILADLYQVTPDSLLQGAVFSDAA